MSKNNRFTKEQKTAILAHFELTRGLAQTRGLHVELSEDMSTITWFEEQGGKRMFDEKAISPHGQTVTAS